MFFFTTTSQIRKWNTPFEIKVNVNYEVGNDLEDAVKKAKSHAVLVDSYRGHHYNFVQNSQSTLK